MSEIQHWLEGLGLGEYSQTFESQKIDLEALAYLTEDDLKEMALPIGPRRKILAAISKGLPRQDVKDSTTSPVPTALKPTTRARQDTKPITPSPTSGVAERRQLTVMFCDLVGSTQLSTKHDPEVLREIMGSYQTAAAAVIESYDGHVAQYLGDGLMVYFGWPHAHEDDAVRAVRAGLEVIEAVKKLHTAAQLSVRVGIATGPVVVGETGGGDPSVPKTAVGETPNLAARVQGIAEPNTIAIGGITRGLIGSAFELERLGSHSLKGITDPVELYQVLGDKGAESRFEATYADHLTPVVGRNTEIAMQLDRWQRAKDGEGQVILLSGEPGIGKSRLIHMLREKLAEETYIPIRYQCSTHHTNSALYPVIDQLKRAAGFIRGDDNDTKLDKIESLLGKSSPNVGEVVCLFATLLSLSADRYPVLEATPEEIKKQTLAALNDQLLGLASQNPVVFLIEDVQWCDPTTLELIGDMITRITDARVLLVITYRPEFEPTWTGHAHVSVQTLNRLSRREGSEVVDKVTGGKSLPKEVLNLIVAKTDGIPLYVEELTKNVLEAGFLRDAGDRYELDGPLPSLAIPTTLQESLIARLDRLNTVKMIAQIGACIGREFSHELVASVSPLSDTELQSAFRQLVDLQIILPQGGSNQDSYTFKHALLQDAAYSSLLKGPRRQFHDRIADGLISKFPEVVTNTPEVVAAHLAKAERFNEAVDYWKGAGIRAKNASSNQEAIHYFQTALASLKKEAASLSRDKLELELTAPLAHAMTALYGFSSPKTSTAYERAFQITQKMDSPPELFQIMYGLSTTRFMADKFLDGLAIAKEFASYSDVAGDKAGYTMAHRTYGGALIWLPDYKTSKLHLEKSVVAYDELNSHGFVEEYGSDPKVMSFGILGLAHVYSGFPDQAVSFIDKAMSHAEKLNFPFMTAWVHWMGTWIFRDLDDVQQTEKHTRALLQITMEKNISPMKQAASIISGWVEYRKNKPEYLETIEHAFKELTDLGSVSFQELRHIVDYIDAAIREKQIEKATQKIERALTLIETQGSKWSLPDILRRKALCKLTEPHSNPIEVEAMLLDSLELAKSQEAKLWELRSAGSLATLWGEKKERQKAYDLLFPIYDWYTEGLNTPVLQKTKVLLEQLQ